MPSDKEAHSLIQRYKTSQKLVMRMKYYDRSSLYKSIFDMTDIMLRRCSSTDGPTISGFKNKTGVSVISKKCLCVDPRYFGRHQSFLIGHWYPYWTSGDYRSWFPSQVGFLTCVLLCLHEIASSESRLVQHLLTANTACDPFSSIYLYTYFQALVGSGILHSEHSNRPNHSDSASDLRF